MNNYPQAAPNSINLEVSILNLYPQVAPNYTELGVSVLNLYSQVAPNSIDFDISILNLYPQAAPNSDFIQKSSSKSDSKKNKPQQINKPNVECVTKAGTSTLSSLSNLPPLLGVNLPMKQPTGSLPGISQSRDMHKIKSMIDSGLGMLPHEFSA